ncbi:hypothetical protein F0562_031230 [Nyssa sinensis]|uniref:procollagen-proline 4-dioxygenase n=1 Tax=Nyssa sinensis TaxID=561372 RepID=A0A5J5ART6_9ASTE|nr:hypothetical protein F0562_031230 [Nyssa sinensis]
MATHLSILFLLAFTFSFASIFAETRKELRAKGVNQETIIQMGRPIQSNRTDPSRVIQLSWRPRVFLYRGFLSDEECDKLISLAYDMKENSMGNGDDPANIDTNKLLTVSESSTNTKDDITSRIEKRISAWTFLPKENSTPLQVMHFVAEEAKQNYDYFGNKSTLVLSEPLMATVVLYLSNVTDGGQILFPESELENSQVKNKIWSDCTKSSNTLRPTKGNAMLFFNLHLNASRDRSSSHARCPVLEGEMWCATKLFHVRAITSGKAPPQSDDSDCTDEDENCPRWAALGECQKNPVFMIGTPDYYGTCKKSCNAC